MESCDDWWCHQHQSWCRLYGILARSIMIATDFSFFLARSPNLNDFLSVRPCGSDDPFSFTLPYRAKPQKASECYSVSEWIRHHLRKSESSVNLKYLLAPNHIIIHQAIPYKRFANYKQSQTTMLFSPRHSAASTSIAMVFLLHLIGLLVLVPIGPYSNSASAFQSQCVGPRTSKTILSAARRDDTNGALRQKTKGIHKNYDTDIARVWAKSLEETIPWHASSRRYLSQGSHATLPSLVDEDAKETNQNHHSVPWTISPRGTHNNIQRALEYRHK